MLVFNNNRVLLIQREKDSTAFPGKWALPGGLINKDEYIREAASRELKEETGIEVPLSFWKYVDTPGRDPRGRSITFVFYGKTSKPHAVRYGDDAQDVEWFSVHRKDIPNIHDLQIAFDHLDIIEEFIDSPEYYSLSWSRS